MVSFAQFSRDTNRKFARQWAKPWFKWTMISLLIVLVVGGVILGLWLGGVLFSSESLNPEEGLCPTGVWTQTRVITTPQPTDILSTRMRAGPRSKFTYTYQHRATAGDGDSALKSFVVVWDLTSPASNRKTFESKSDESFLESLAVPTDGVGGSDPMQIAVCVHTPVSTLAQSSGYGGRLVMYNEDGTSEVQSITRSSSRPWSIGYDPIGDAMYVAWVSSTGSTVVGYRYVSNVWTEFVTISAGTALVLDITVTRHTLYIGDANTGKVFVHNRSGDGYSSTFQTLNVFNGTSVPRVAESADGLKMSAGDYVDGGTVAGDVLNFARTSSTGDFATDATSTLSGEALDGFGYDVVYAYGSSIIATRNDFASPFLKPLQYNVDTKVNETLPTFDATKTIPLVERYFEPNEKEFYFYLLEAARTSNDNTNDAIFHQFVSPSKACE